ncbi:MAG: type I secretion system permease/ATPase [Pseudomonadota bacterium]
MSDREKSPGRRELSEAFQSVRHYFVYAGAFSAAVNLLMLTPIIYMLQVYDRVITSGSLPTLAMLTILLVFLLSSMGVFEWVRSMILVSASNRIEHGLRDRVFDATFSRALKTGGMNTSSQPVSDLSSLRQFMTSNGIFAFFDAPWYPIYVGIMFLFHFWFGVVAIIAGIIMVVLAIINEKVTTKKLQNANEEANQLDKQINSSLRNSEVIGAMGMIGNIRKSQQSRAERVLKLQSEASRSGGRLTSISKTFRVTTQSLILGLGAWLAVRQEISPGMMIAGSLLLGRALAPIDTLVGSWKGFSVARAQYNRLAELLEQIPPEPERMDLPQPVGQLTVDKIVVPPPGSRTPVVRGVDFELKAGETLGIVGPSGSGKSSLARAILGLWAPVSGNVRLDGADVADWDHSELGPSLGYLPQDIELFEGTVAENICRFGEAESEQIVAAAKMAGVHDMILHLPDGYDTIIGGMGGMLSGGQRQRIGLARAVFGNPRLIVLDEPNSNLDDQGARELVAALQRLAGEGRTVVVITHRMMILNSVDRILVMKEGAAASFGPRDEVLAQLTGQLETRAASAGD